MINTLSRYFHTIRHLKPRQITSRLKRRIRPVGVPQLPSFSPRPPIGNWQKPAARLQSMWGPSEFRFLNQNVSVNDASAWIDPSALRLLQYNLHYFDDLSARGSVERVEWHREIVDRWIQENAPGSAPGWEPYPTSLRIVNWIKWHLGAGDLTSNQLRSLALQAEWLSRNIEYHLLGNHLFANAKALYFAGCFYAGGRPDTWRGTGLRIICEEIQEQILQDGGHFELSPMYHCIALEDILDILNIGNAFDSLLTTETHRDLVSTVTRMLDWLQSMCHPDGEIALLNDSAFGIAPCAEELWDYALRFGLASGGGKSCVYLENSGYVSARTGEAFIIADIGQIGPDYLPGHAHADTLSFELSLFGDRWIVDTGCSTYEANSERLRQRGTGAHNTVIVDDSDSSEVWSSFRVARRARPCAQSVKQESNEVRISGSHDGYMRLPGRVSHTRIWRLGTRSIQISDSISGTYRQAESRLLLHPDIRVEEVDQSLVLTREDRSARLTADSRPCVVDSTWHPEFGRSIPTRQIRVPIENGHSKLTLAW